MKRAVCIFGVAVLVMALCADQSVAQAVLKAGNDSTDPVALGEPLSHWLTVIRSRNPEEMEMAFDAIVELGPAARKAVPDLIRIVANLFLPIRVGTEDRRETLLKLLNIHLRAGAVDSLAAIGEPAASAAGPVIQWALTVRVLPSEVRTPMDAFYVEFVGMDVLERMRGAGAIARFGVQAADAVQKLMESRDEEKRKFAVAVLNEGSLPIVTALMTSERCRARALGLAILADMWPVVAIDHLNALKDIVFCLPGNSEEGAVVGVAPARLRRTKGLHAVNLLRDTNALLWFALGDARVGPPRVN
jgi:hypothetical protein